MNSTELYQRINSSILQLRLFGTLVHNIIKINITNKPQHLNVALKGNNSFQMHQTKLAADLSVQSAPWPNHK